MLGENAPHSIINASEEARSSSVPDSFLTKISQ